MDDVVIRMAEPAEAWAAADLRWTWDVENGAAPAMTQPEYRAAFEAWASEHRSTHTCFFAERDGEVIGMTWLAITARVPTPRSTARLTADLQSVYVAPSARNEGVGGLLIEAALAAATALGAERAVVHSSSRAVTAYARAGFASSATLMDVSLPR
jgi:GNAT superfamily N-acetyltransferase